MKLEHSLPPNTKKKGSRKLMLLWSRACQPIQIDEARYATSKSPLKYFNKSNKEDVYSNSRTSTTNSARPTFWEWAYGNRFWSAKLNNMIYCKIWVTAKDPPIIHIKTSTLSYGVTNYLLSAQTVAGKRSELLKQLATRVSWSSTLDSKTVTYGCLVNWLQQK